MWARRCRGRWRRRFWSKRGGFMGGRTFVSAAILTDTKVRPPQAVGLWTMSRQPRLTLELHRQIAAAIRAGGFPHIAAQAFGVPAPVWDNWLRRGTARGAREPTG